MKQRSSLYLMETKELFIIQETSKNDYALAIKNYSKFKIRKPNLSHVQHSRKKKAKFKNRTRQTRFF